MNAVYFCASLTAFALTGVMHIASYFQPNSVSGFYAVLTYIAVLSVPLILLFRRVKNEGQRGNVWQRFCGVWGGMTVGWCLGVLSFVRTFFGHGSSADAFRTAWLLMPAGAVLSYAVTLIRALNADAASR